MRDHSLKPETELVQRLQQNDEEALGLLMGMYYNDLYNYAARFTKEDGLIKDCIQEIFISLWQRRETANTILCPRYYFLRAVKNKVLKALHKNLRNASLTNLQNEYEFFHEFSIEQVTIEKQVTEEKAAKLRQTLSLLSKKQKEIVYLKYYLYMDHGQIAELMNLNRQSVYNLLHETMHKLRTLLQIEFINQ
ncbi:MAG: sigma-70 family RNA polymerase sigma factor [Bacteroidota bacterium]